MKKTLSISIAILFFTSCSIQKRQYNKGYYLSFNHHKRSASSLEKIDLKPYDLSAGTQKITANSTSEKHAQKPMLEIKSLVISNVPSPIFEECDLIILKTGEEIKAHVLEIAINEIKYKRCDNPNGPTISIAKSEVFMVKYPNGTKDLIANIKAEQDELRASKNIGNQNKTIHGFAIASFAVGLGSFFGFLAPGAGIAGGIVAIVFAILALMRINKNPEKFKGKTLAIWGLSLGIVATLVFMIVFSILLGS